MASRIDGHNVWFAPGDKLNAVDPASGKKLRSIDVAAHAGTAFDGQHLFQIAEDRIQKIDPKTGRVLATIPAPGGGGDSGSTWAEGTLWVGQYRDRKIHQVDPADRGDPSHDRVQPLRHRRHLGRRRAVARHLGRRRERVCGGSIREPERSWRGSTCRAGVASRGSSPTAAIGSSAAAAAAASCEPSAAPGEPQISGAVLPGAPASLQLFSLGQWRRIVWSARLPATVCPRPAKAGKGLGRGDGAAVKSRPLSPPSPRFAGRGRTASVVRCPPHQRSSDPATANGAGADRARAARGCARRAACPSVPPHPSPARKLRRRAPSHAPRRVDQRPRRRWRPGPAAVIHRQRPKRRRSRRTPDRGDTPVAGRYRREHRRAVPQDVTQSGCDLGGVDGRAVARRHQGLHAADDHDLAARQLPRAIAGAQPAVIEHARRRHRIADVAGERRLGAHQQLAVGRDAISTPATGAPTAPKLAPRAGAIDVAPVSSVCP